MNRSSTKRTTRSRPEPRVDTINMEHVAAFGKDTSFVVFFKLRQANRALLQWRFMGFNGVDEDGDLLENRRIKRTERGGGLSRVSSGGE